MTALDLAAGNIPTKFPSVNDYSNLGTAAGTTTISTYPCILHAIALTQGVASGKIIIYDSVGTSTSVIGSIALGTQLVSNLTGSYIFDVRTKTALTVENTANVGCVVSFGK